MQAPTPPEPDPRPDPRPLPGPLSGAAAGRLMIAAGVLGVVAGLVGTVVGWRLLSTVDAALTDSVAVTADALEALDGSVALVEDTIGLVDDGLTDAESAAGEVAGALGQGEDLLASTADLTGTRLADSVDAVEASLPTLERVAAAIDGTLTALDRLPVGPAYNPEEPFDESVRDLRGSLDGVSGQLRDQAVLLTDAGEQLGDAGEGAAAVADDLGRVAAGLDEARGLLEGYAATTADASTLVERAERDLTGQVTAARVAIGLLGAAVVLGQVVPLSVGWGILARSRPAPPSGRRQLR